MPAFTFEKISPPVRRGPVPPIANKKQRGVIVRLERSDEGIDGKFGGGEGLLSSGRRRKWQSDQQRQRHAAE